MIVDLSFFKGKHVLVTGHTGFKGSWLCRILIDAGADVTGYSLAPPTQPDLFSSAGIEGRMDSVISDIRDYDKLLHTFRNARPEIVFHLAAQPIVRESYHDPRNTYSTNVIGTVNLLECVREVDSVKSVLNVTTDKVYQNHEWCWGYRESETLDGFDPYSNSKSCSELVTNSYVRSFFQGTDVAVSTARAGNVIGGGDFSPDRIIPDCFRAVERGEPIGVRNPGSVRPYQHVLEALCAYLTIVQAQTENKAYAGAYNVGPGESNCVTTSELVDLFCKCWGNGAKWENHSKVNDPHEANFLRLDCSKIRSVLGWKPKWSIEKSMEMICRFGKVWQSGGDIPAEMDSEIESYFCS